MRVRVVIPGIQQRIRALQDLQQSTGKFMPQVEKLMKEDNQTGLQASTDRFGKPLAPLAASSVKKGRLVLKPLIPHGIFSRVITQYKTTYFQRGRSWVVIGAWINLLSKTGIPFLGFHIEGHGNNPQRDIAGVRPAGLAKIKKAYTAFVLGKLRGGK